MQEILFYVLNMSISSGIVILAIMLARLMLKKAPKKWSYLLWGAAVFRLCCPVSIKSAFSLFSFVPKVGNASNAASAAGRLQYIPNVAEAVQNQHQIAPAIPNLEGLPSGTSLVAPNSVPMSSASGGISGAAQAAAPSLAQNLMAAAVIIWLAGMLAMIAYSVISYIRLHRRMDTAVRMEGNVYQSEFVCSPFILGFIRPRIYIPYGLDANSRSYVLAHERYHLKRGDHLIKVLSFLLLAVHWFNPLCWLAFLLANKDMEMSCDEKVLGERLDIRKDYSTTLLSFAVRKQFPAASPLAFCESGIRSRIKNAMNYKKPKFIVTFIALVLCIAVLAACVANPIDTDTTPDSQEVNASASPTDAPTEAPTTDTPATDAPTSAPETESPTLEPTEAPVAAEHIRIEIKENEQLNIDMDFDGVMDSIIWNYNESADLDGWPKCVITVIHGTQSDTPYVYSLNGYVDAAYVIDCDLSDNRLDILFSTSTETGFWESCVLRVNEDASGMFSQIVDHGFDFDDPDLGPGEFSVLEYTDLTSSCTDGLPVTATATIDQQGLKLLSDFKHDTHFDAEVFDGYLVLVQEMPLKIVNSDGSLGEQIMVPIGERLVPVSTDLNSYENVRLPDGRIGRIEFIDGGINGIPVYSYFSGIPAGI